MATSSRYRVHVPLDYEGKHVEAGSIVSNLPSSSLKWLKDSGYVTLIPKGAKAEEYPQLDPATGMPVGSEPEPPEPGTEGIVAAAAIPAPAEDARPDPSSEHPVAVHELPDDHPAAEVPDDDESDSTERDPDSEEQVPAEHEPPPSEPPADTDEEEES